jgi:hypothetical protein
MYDQLKTRLAGLLSRPRPLKAQTERALVQHLEEHSTTLQNFFLCASAVLEEYELDIPLGRFSPPRSMNARSCRICCFTGGRQKSSFEGSWRTWSRWSRIHWFACRMGLRRS